MLMTPTEKIEHRPLEDQWTGVSLVFRRRSVWTEIHGWGRRRLAAESAQVSESEFDETRERLALDDVVDFEDLWFA